MGTPAGGSVDGAHHAKVNVAQLAIRKFQQVALMRVTANTHQHQGQVTCTVGTFAACHLCLHLHSTGFKSSLARANPALDDDFTSELSGCNCSRLPDYSSQDADMAPLASMARAT